MTERKVHPVIMVEIEYGDGRGLCGHGRGPELASYEFAFAGIFVNQSPCVTVLATDRAGTQAGSSNVHGTIIVVVGSHGRKVGRITLEPNRFGRVSKSAIAVVSPHHICADQRS